MIWYEDKAVIARLFQVYQCRGVLSVIDFMKYDIYFHIGYHCVKPSSLRYPHINLLMRAREYEVGRTMFML